MNASSAVEALKALHVPCTYWYLPESRTGCRLCGGYLPKGEQVWPCETRRILDLVTSA